MTDIHVQSRNRARSVAHREDEARALAGVAWLESGYARARYQCPVELVGAPRGPVVRYGITRPPTAGVESRGNLGAIQAGPSWEGDVFWALDSSPLSEPERVAARDRAIASAMDEGLDAVSAAVRGAAAYAAACTWYAHPYRAYSSWEDAWRDLADQVLRRRESVAAAARSGPLAVSRALYASRYYEGFGVTQEERVHHHCARLSVGWYLADIAEGIERRRETLREGASGELVRDWQGVIGARQDGRFGPLTASLTRAWQRARHLTADGVVGTSTWAWYVENGGVLCGT